MDRRPTPAHTSSPLPSLDAVRAEGSPLKAQPLPAPSLGRRVAAVSVAAGVAAVAGGVVHAADAPACGTTRAAELEAHAASATQGLRRGDLAQTLQELGRALGWVPHGSTTVGVPPDDPRPGEAPGVPPPETITSGAMVRVDPTPRIQGAGGMVAVDAPPPAEHVRRGGIPRRVDPTPGGRTR